MESQSNPSAAIANIDGLLAEMRPKLHRYCARMTGSVIDGEDVLQDALIKAVESFASSRAIGNPEGWLFRIAHNTAVDFLRQRARHNAARSDEDPDMVVDTASTPEDRQFAAASLRTFMRLPVAQRSSVILMDVLGYSLDEIGRMTDTSISAVKAALHRGRERLREIAKEPEDIPVPVLPESERALLAAYVDRFNARDFDAIRNMLADEVRLELVNRARMNGRSEVARYFHNYNNAEDWQFVLALVDRRPALVVRDPGDPLAAPAYFVLLQWAGDRLTNIRDFRYARYAIEGAEIVLPR
jgi:RNA polymerase sigma-70 factor (ECF subfamily)